jgi:hypothetical protein
MRDDNRSVESYRAHDLVAAKSASGYQGVAWKDTMKLHKNIGDSLKDVLQKLRQYVDAAIDKTAKGRTAPPSGDEYLVAFKKMLGSLRDGHYAMLKAHYLAPDQTITATKLAAAAGYRNYSAANLHYGNVGKALYEELPVELRTRDDGSLIYTSALATAGETTDSDEHWAWKLRPEVAYAIERLGLGK